MLKHFRNRKGQNTAEYAILIALVVGGVIAMQTYAQRALQGRLRDASVSYRDQTSVIGNTLQYEPYYTNTVSNMVKTSTATDTYYDQTRSNLNTKRTAGTSDQSDYITAAVASTGQTAEVGF
jgi:Flp pilus assembly pilin Flp